MELKPHDLLVLLKAGDRVVVRDMSYTPHCYVIADIGAGKKLLWTADYEA